MDSASLVVGRSYAFREKRSAQSRLLKVKLLEMVGRKGKVKIRFEDGPHPGLEEYISTRQILVPWGERNALLRDEQRLAALNEYAGTVADRVLAEAASAVLEASGEAGLSVEEKVTWNLEDALQRVCDRAGVRTAPVDLHRLGFVDRGRIHLPLDAMVRLAQAFAAAEPQAVNGYVDDREEEMRLRGNVPGDRWWRDYLRENAPAFALARRWAGLEQEADSLRQEIARLRMLVSSAVSELKNAGRDREAARLRRALDGL